MEKKFCELHPDRCENWFQANNLTVYIVFGVRTIFTLTVSFLIFKREQFKSMSQLTKLAFIGFNIQWLLLSIYISAHCVAGIKLDVLNNISQVIFYENHWLFAAHYLRVACLFRLLFSSLTENDLAVMKKRNCLLLSITILFGLFVAVILITFTYTTYQKGYFVVKSIINTCEWIIALVNLISILFIAKKYQALK